MIGIAVLNRFYRLNKTFLVQLLVKSLHLQQHHNNYVVASLLLSYFLIFIFAAATQRPWALRLLEDVYREKYST